MMIMWMVKMEVVKMMVVKGRDGGDDGNGDRDEVVVLVMIMTMKMILVVVVMMLMTDHLRWTERKICMCGVEGSEEVAE